MNLRLPRISLLCLSLLLTACMVGPNYVRPSATVPDNFKEAQRKNAFGPPAHQNHHKTITYYNETWKTATPQDLVWRGAWWKLFQDPQLNALEDELNISNQTIKNAAANYRQACALVAEARAGLFPSVAAAAVLTRQKTGASTSSSSSLTAGGSTSASISTSHTLLLDATWEPDIWGSVGRQIEANMAGAQASDALLAATALSAQASLAQFYFELRGVDADQKILNDTVVAYKKSLSLTKNQYRAGIAAQADIVQAQSQLETAEAATIHIGIIRAQYEHAIAVLIGQPPANFSLTAQNYPIIILPHIPALLPSALLERRPDIGQAERQMAQANAEIGIAVAAYFPALTLSATGDVAGGGLAHWFSLPALNWALGAQLAETILDGGLRQATIAATRANYEATVANYREVILSAFQDTEDNLAALSILQAELKMQNKAANSAREALALVINQYQAGIVAYTDVITAQTRAYLAERTASDVLYLQMSAAIGLLKSLGGGWYIKTTRSPD